MGFSLVFFKYGSILAYFLGFTGNFLMIALILSQDDQYIRKYSAYLLQTTFLETFLTLLSLLIIPISGKLDNIFYVFSGNEILNLETMSLLITMTFYFSIIISLVGGTIVPFYIRYLVICKKKVIQPMHYFWVYGIFTIFFCVIFFIMFFVLHYGTTVYGNFTRMIGTKAIFTGPLFITFFSLIILFFTAISTVIIYRLHLRIIKQLASKNVFMHIKIKTLSKSLQETLYVQSVCLLVGAAFAGSILLISSFIECEYCSSYGFLFITWAPIFNPICIFKMMEVFRQKLTRILEILRFKKTTQVSAFSVNANYFN